MAFEVKRKMAYKAFGLRISSDLYLPELNTITNNNECFDIYIYYDDKLQTVIQNEFEARKFTVNESCVMFFIEDLASFCIRNGKEIIVSSIKNADIDKIRLYILGTCMGVLLMQRKILPLHGSAIAINGKAIAIVGHSGAGKSTLASAFIREGYQILTDDVIAVSISENNIPIIHPSYPQQKLWQESLQEFNMDSNNYLPLFERETKYSIPVNSNFFGEPLQLMGVFELVVSNNELIGLRKINGLEQFRTLLLHTFRTSLIPRLELTEWHFMYSSKIINSINMYQVERPVTRFTANSLVNLIIDTLKLEEAHD